nr:hypothetical protein [Candidatus Acidoferrales bacterium]
MTTKRESEILLFGILPLAKKMLKEYGEFHPYGGYLDCEGKIVEVGVDDPDTEYPKGRDLVYVLKSRFREMASANECKAVAVVFNVIVTLPDSENKSDAIQVSIEHVDGYSAEVFLPYRISDGEVAYRDVFSQEGKHDIFESS